MSISARSNLDNPSFGNRTKFLFKTPEMAEKFYDSLPSRWRGLHSNGDLFGQHQDGARLVGLCLSPVQASKREYAVVLEDSTRFQKQADKRVGWLTKLAKRFNPDVEIDQYKQIHPMKFLEHNMLWKEVMEPGRANYIVSPEKPVDVWVARHRPDTINTVEPESGVVREGNLRYEAPASHYGEGYTLSTDESGRMYAKYRKSEFLSYLNQGQRNAKHTWHNFLAKVFKTDNSGKLKLPAEEVLLRTAPLEGEEAIKMWGNN